MKLRREPTRFSVGLVFWPHTLSGRSVRPDSQVEILELGEEGLRGRNHRVSSGLLIAEGDAPLLKVGLAPGQAGEMA